MNLKVNGDDTEAPEGTNVLALLTLKEVKMPEMVSVELNGEILDREAFESTALKENDAVEFLYFMGGGKSA